VSLLQRRHYNHLAEMTKAIVEQIDGLTPPDGSVEDSEAYIDAVKYRITEQIVNYMRIGNMNFNEHRFRKAAGMIDEEA